MPTPTLLPLKTNADRFWRQSGPGYQRLGCGGGLRSRLQERGAELAQQGIRFFLLDSTSVSSKSRNVCVLFAVWEHINGCLLLSRALATGKTAKHHHKERIVASLKGTWDGGKYFSIQSPDKERHFTDEKLIQGISRYKSSYVWGLVIKTLKNIFLSINYFILL